MRAARQLFTISTDNHASRPEAFAASVREKVLPFDCELRRVKYLNNVTEQDHRAIEGIEAMHMMRKGQVKRIGGRDVIEQVKFVESPFGIAA